MKQPVGLTHYLKRWASSGTKTTPPQCFNLLRCWTLFKLPPGTPPPHFSKPTPSSWSTTHLPRFGRGLDVRDAVGAGQLLGLPGVHRASRQVTLVSHQHHGNVVRVLHAFDLFSAGRQRSRQLVRNCQVKLATEDTTLPPPSREVAGSILAFSARSLLVSV